MLQPRVRPGGGPSCAKLDAAAELASQSLSVKQEVDIFLNDIQAA
jgi:hypothetical protein